MLRNCTSSEKWLKAARVCNSQQNTHKSVTTSSCKPFYILHFFKLTPHINAIIN